MKTKPFSYEQLCQRSAKQPYPFPIQNNRIANLTAPPLNYSAAQITHQAANVRLLIHPKTRQLATSFLQKAITHGSKVEQAYYQAIDLPAFLHKLIAKRPLMFMLPDDAYILPDMRTGSGGFDHIGTEQESVPLVLSQYNSYREMAIAALLGVSVPTYFINEGSRDNSGQIAPIGTFQEQGIYSGLVGARFERPGKMEWQHMIITEEQNTASNGYGTEATGGDWTLPLWAEYYDCGSAERFYFPDYTTASQNQSGQYVSFPNHDMFGNSYYLNTQVYKKRLKMVIEPFLRDANERAKAAETTAYVVAVGLGIGVWAIPSLQDLQAKLQVEVYAEALAANALSHISDLRFSWFPAATHHLADQFPSGVNVSFDRQSPMVKLEGEHADKLLVANYAWDGNSYPGNEYWQGSLTASGDPAAACCSTISELQNPDVNPYLAAEIGAFYQI